MDTPATPTDPERLSGTGDDDLADERERRDPMQAPEPGSPALFGPYNERDYGRCSNGHPLNSYGRCEALNTGAEQPAPESSP